MPFISLKNTACALNNKANGQKIGGIQCCEKYGKLVTQSPSM